MKVLPLRICIIGLIAYLVKKKDLNSVIHTFSSKNLEKKSR